MKKSFGSDDAAAPQVTGSGQLLVVRTASSVYLVDIEGGWVMRRPGGYASDLRQDAAPVKLVELSAPIHLGKPMRMVLTGLAEPGVLTVRCTTPVIGIVVGGLK